MGAGAGAGGAALSAAAGGAALGAGAAPGTAPSAGVAANSATAVHQTTPVPLERCINGSTLHDVQDDCALTNQVLDGANTPAGLTKGASASRSARSTRSVS